MPSVYTISEEFIQVHEIARMHISAVCVYIQTQTPLFDGTMNMNGTFMGCVQKHDDCERDLLVQATGRGGLDHGDDYSS